MKKEDEEQSADKKTECFRRQGGFEWGKGRFAMTSIEDVRKAGREAGKALKNI